jgi:hypothetical protein
MCKGNIERERERERMAALSGACQAGTGHEWRMLMCACPAQLQPYQQFFPRQKQLCTGRM